MMITKRQYSTLLLLLFLVSTIEVTQSRSVSNDNDGKRLLQISTNLPSDPSQSKKVFGPYEEGTRLDLNCSLSSGEDGDLIWEIENKEISPAPLNHNAAHSIMLAFVSLKLDDGDFEYTCRSKRFEVHKTVKINVVEKILRTDAEVNIKPIVENERYPINSENTVNKEDPGTINKEYPGTINKEKPGIVNYEEPSTFSNDESDIVNKEEPHGIVNYEEPDTNINEEDMYSNESDDNEVYASLSVTGSILLDRPVFDGVFGPYVAGEQLTLTCDSPSDGDISLSWWKGDTKLLSEDKFSVREFSSAYSIEKLSIYDDATILTCKTDRGGYVKNIKLNVVQPISILEANGPEITNGILHVVNGGTLELICVTQGYKPEGVTWWKDDVQLNIEEEKSRYARSSVLKLSDLQNTDNDITVECRSERSRQSRKLLLQFPAEPEIAAARVVSEELSSSPLQKPLVVTAIVIWTVIACCVAAIVIVACCRKKNPSYKQMQELPHL